MNPAALKVNIADLKPNGILIVNTDEFADRNLKKAGYDGTRSRTASLAGFRVFQVALTTLTRRRSRTAVSTPRRVDRCKNFFALGMIYWLYSRPLEPTIALAREEVRRAAGARRGQPAGAEGRLQLRRHHRGRSRPATRSRRRSSPPGDLPQHHGQHGARARARGRRRRQLGLPLFSGAYPITPASRHPPRAGAVQALRRDDVPGRGRDRGDLRRDRRRLRRLARGHHDLAARASRSRARRSAWR